MCAHKHKIGVMDSGIGGLSVLREIHQQLPDMPTVYFADQAHLPYGIRKPHQIFAYVDAITQFLLQNEIGLLVIACHSASADALEPLREKYPDLPIVGIEPAIKPAIAASKTRIIGVLTTHATANGQLYRRILGKYANGTEVLTQITPDLVTLTESGDWNSERGRAIIRENIAPLLAAGADQIVLACTHFPFLAEAIREELGDAAALIEPGAAVARQVARILPTTITPQPDTPNAYYTSGNPANFASMLKRLLDIDAPVSQQAIPNA